MSSRGLFELTTPKSIAYAISALGFFFFFAIFIARGKFKIRVDRKALLISALFFLSSILSLIISLFYGIEAEYSYYIAYPAFITAIFIFFYSIKAKTLDEGRLSATISTLILILFTSATLQQFNLINLPGETPAFYEFIVPLYRPSSFTGSYLHYPLLMVALGAFLTSINGRLTSFAVLAYISPFLALSRSGMLLVTIIAVLSIIGTIKSRKLSAKSILISTFLLFLALVILIKTELIHLISHRFLSLESTAAGNSVRIESWKHGVDLFLNGNVLFGSNFGKITNFTSNLTELHATVVESGALQNLVNFGFIGSMFFYSLFAFSYVNSVAGPWRFFIIALFIQSFVYQSTEVLPLMIMLFLFSSILSKKHFTLIKTSFGSSHLAVAANRQ